MSKNRLDQAPAKIRKSVKRKRKSPEDRKREPNDGSFKPGDPRINYKGRPPDLVGYRQMLREVGEEKALNYLLECMKLGKGRDGKQLRPNSLGMMAAVEWLHQARGKPRQQIAVTGFDDGPVRVADGPDLSKLSVAELKAWRELVRKAQPEAALQ